MPTELEREQALLHQLRASGDPAALREADQLQSLYHDRQMDGLAADAYQAAKGEGHPPPGWTRLSEHPELVAEYAAKLHTSPDELRRTLHPDDSGFRAEIYLPDAAMQQAGYKLTPAFKGSSGKVMTSDGKPPHDTTTEDFAANNFPQSVGLETDYYDRAMQLGYELKQNGVDFESTGHSLAGGMAAAVAAVTGTRATTFNAAGLNPVTTERFAQQNPGVIVPKDLTHLITNYQVQGELLSDGIQNNFHNMDALRRQELGATLKEVCDVLQRVPDAKDLFAQKLGAGLPPQAQVTVNAFVNKLAAGDVSRMLHDLPLAAGSQHVLAAMTRDAQGNLVPRVQVTSLPETTQLATPLLESLAVVSVGVHLGERGGELVRAGGHLEAQGLHATGRGVDAATTTAGTGVHAMTRAEGAVVQTGEHAMGATLAHARTAQAEVSAQFDQGLGQATHLSAEFDAMLLRGAGHLLPEHAQHAAETQAARLEQAGLAAQRQGTAAAAVDRHAGQVDAVAIRNVTHTMETATEKAADAYGIAEQTVIGGTGHYARAGLDATAQRVEGTARHAPAAFATAGAVVGAGLAFSAEFSPSNYPHLVEAATAISHGKQAGSEAFERHLLAPTVTPSLDASIQAKEREAVQTLQHIAPAHTPPAPDPQADPTRRQQRSLHGESSQADRTQEAQRQQETQGHTAAREARLPPAPAAIPPGMRVPEREPSPVSNRASPSQDTQTHAPARPEPATTIEPSHAALATQQAQRARSHEESPAPPARTATSLEPGRFAEAAALAPSTVPSQHATAPTLSPPLDPPSMRDFRHAEHPLNARYQMFRDALGEQGFHQDRPTLNEVPAVRGYSAEQKDRLAAGFTGQLGADQRYHTEIQHFGKEGNALLAVEHPQRLGATPLVLAIPEAKTLARTPEEHAAAWRARELPAPQAVNTARPDPQTLSPEHPGHPDHPHHAMFEHAREALSSEYARWGLQKGSDPLDRETMQVMIAARDRKMDDVGAIRLWKGSPDGRIAEHPMLSVYDTAHGPQQSLSNPGVNMGVVESQTLQHAPPVQQAAQQLQAVDQQATQQIQQAQQWQAQINAQGQQASAMGGPGMGR